MDTADTALPRWMQGDWSDAIPLKAEMRVDARVREAEAATPSVESKRTATATQTAPIQPHSTSPQVRRFHGPIAGLAALLLAAAAFLLLAAQGIASPERGLTVALPDPQDMPEIALAAMDSGDPEGLLTPSEALTLSPEEAAAVREAIQADLGRDGYDGPRPQGIAFRAATAADRERALQCLTQAIYYEAGLEPEAGQRAVAQVILNRVRHPDYPNSICGVVYQGSERSTGCQFTFTCDGALARTPAASIWARARRYAAEAIDGRAFGDVGYATHYHTFEVWPYWGRRLTMTNMIGRHIFHRLRGRGSDPGFFTQRYSGRESGPRPWRPRPAEEAVAAADMPVADGASGSPTEEALEMARATDNLPPAPVARSSRQERTQVAEAAEPNNLPRSGVIAGTLPESTVRPEFRNSGRWIGD
ncbi:cell wall hydrolase [uncultured Parasphingopyxis sp.]|uniref:cell wall hydrolase n=1 Tax=uncultured Parasphingopyxis sp. TaxID=1547918 RepID=UPI00260A1AE0|nr:cell wall hydrolase [uncultured Parasphingopyxis sp.]